jgi:hypothetical protein
VVDGGVGAGFDGAVEPGFDAAAEAGLGGAVEVGFDGVVEVGVGGVVEVEVGVGVGGAVTATVADALGAVRRLAALPIAVRLTDVTVEAVTGTVSCAWSCRCADCASIVPRSHEDVPSSLPQPKLNPGAPPTVGRACSRMVASWMFPPVVQALTVHWAEWPRSVLACARVTSTQRLARVVSDTAVAVLVLVLVTVPVAVGVGVRCALRVRVGTGAGDEAVGVADGETLIMALVRVADGDGLAVGVRLGVALGDLLVVVGVAARVPVAGFPVVGFEVADFEVAGFEVAGFDVAGFVVGAAGVGDGLARGVGGCSGSHD